MCERQISPGLTCGNVVQFRNEGAFGEFMPKTKILYQTNSTGHS